MINSRPRWVVRKLDAKMRVKSLLIRHGFGVTRDPVERRLVRLLGHLGVDTIVDVGANIGQFGSHVRAAGFHGRLLSLEPLPNAFARLRGISNRDDLWESICAAAGSRSGRVTVNVAANSVSSSVRAMLEAHEDAAQDSSYIGKTEACIVRLDAFLEARSVVPERCMVKIDTQGFEAEVLEGLGDKLRRLACVQLELSLVPLYAGQALFDPLIARMRDSGFNLVSLEPGFADRQGRMLQCDAVFASTAALDRIAR